MTTRDTLILWLAGFGVPADVLDDHRLSFELSMKDGHGFTERLASMLIVKPGMYDAYREIMKPKARLELASIVEGNPMMFESLE